MDVKIRKKLVSKSDFNDILKNAFDRTKQYKALFNVDGTTQQPYKQVVYNLISKHYLNDNDILDSISVLCLLFIHNERHNNSGGNDNSVGDRISNL